MDFLPNEMAAPMVNNQAQAVRAPHLQRRTSSNIVVSMPR